MRQVFLRLFFNNNTSQLSAPSSNQAVDSSNISGCADDSKLFLPFSTLRSNDLAF